MINEANEPSSACRLWRICKVQTSTPPNAEHRYIRLIPSQSQPTCMVICPMDWMNSFTQYWNKRRVWVRRNRKVEEFKTCFILYILANQRNSNRTALLGG